MNPQNTIFRLSSFLMLLFLSATPLSAMIIPNLVQLATMVADRNPESQYILGKRYSSGKGVTQDNAQAVFWYQKAADKHVRAQCNLGICYARGIGLEKNLELAVHWFQKAATAGLAEAQYNLGNSYKRGIGITQDTFQAVLWLQKAADQKFAPAQIKLFEGFKKAADSQRYIAICYMNGDGTTKNEDQGFVLLQKAANQGDIKAKYYLGMCHERSLGTSHDNIKANEWYAKYIRDTDPDVICPICLEPLIAKQFEQQKDLSNACLNEHLFHIDRHSIKKHPELVESPLWLRHVLILKSHECIFVNVSSF